MYIIPHFLLYNFISRVVFSSAAEGVVRMRKINLTKKEWEDVHEYADSLKVSIERTIILFEEYDGKTNVFGCTRSESGVIEMSYEMRLVEVVAYIQNILRARA